MSRPRNALLFALLATLACSERAAEPLGRTPVPQVPERGPLVRQRIEALLAAAPEEREALPTLEPGREEELRGLLGMAASERGRMRNVALDELAGLGAGAIPALAARLRDPEAPAEERVVAAECLGRAIHPAGGEALLETLEQAREPWLRAHAAWNLARPGHPRQLPRLLLRLKYETDAETVGQIALALARWKSYAGLEALLELARRPNPEEAAAASARLVEMAGLAGVAAPEQLVERWGSARAGELALAAPDLELELAVWRWIGELGGEHFQLRGVDDARYILCRLEVWAVPWLVEGLADEDPYTRLHLCQVLERMGHRAAPAGPALTALLADPQSGPAAAAALGAVAPPTALASLCAATAATRGLELRVAAARALGVLGDRAALPRLRELLEEGQASLDLVRTAARSAVELREGALGAAVLLDELAGGLGDAAGAESALERWLEQAAARAGGTAAQVLALWRASAGSEEQPAPAGARRSERAALLRAHAAELPPACLPCSRALR